VKVLADRTAAGGEPGQSGEADAKTRTVLVVCATFRDHRELARLGRPGMRYLFHDYASTSLEELICGRADGHAGAADPLAETERILAEIGGNDLTAVVSTDDYPGSALAAVLAKALGLPGPEPRANLICQHKYLSRQAQGQIVPEAVPPFWLIDVEVDAQLPAGLCPPAFVKPVKSFFSIGAQRVDALSELAVLKRHWAGLNDFFLPLERLLTRYTGAGIGTRRLIAEGLLKGAQATVEGYVHDGQAHLLGVIDSIFFPGTLAFSRFEYPSALPEGVQARMADIAKRLVCGLGFDHGLFNIEMMYDASDDRIGIVEINPRMASQFADLYEKVDGTNAYEILLDLGAGVAPTPKRGQGQHAFAASSVLRTFDDRLVARLPSEAEQARLALLYPDVRVELHATVGRKLSDELQDGGSYRYGIINLGGQDRADVLERFDVCLELLGISLLPVDAAGEAERISWRRMSR
jgi:hypothetical protein